MRCPFCESDDIKVLETRESEDNKTRRRRECLRCAKRFTTEEQVINATMFVQKKDGRREEFSREKLLKGVLIATGKRPIPHEKIIHLIEDTEARLRELKISEVPSKRIGQEVIKRLKKLDKIAYIRFASVYKELDVDDLEKELDKLRGKEQ
ncbi:MAG: transcriptional repressor NrdR [Candidatus Woesearchaeota archaeon]|nr:MAG: transcriptional repressor NrdR [Candidatus Woesearchaeota archaeon]